MRIDARKLTADRAHCEALFRHYLGKRVLREGRHDLYRKHLNKAIDNLDFANFIMTEHKHSIKEKLPGRTFYDWCVTIYYYSIYRAVLALLGKAGYESKSHMAAVAAITLFYYHRSNVLRKEDIDFLIEKIRLEREDIDLVLDSKDMRERACYGADEHFGLSQAKSVHEQAAGFVNKVRLLLED